MTLRTRVALTAVALLAVAAVFATVMISLIRNADEPLPGITAYAYGRTITVDPMKFCSLRLTDCHRGSPQPTNLPVPAGEPLQLSLPEAITTAPWRLIAVYTDPDGRTIAQQRIYPKGHNAVTVRSTPELPLRGIEIQLPSAVVDRSGIPHARAVWSVRAG